MAMLRGGRLPELADGIYAPVTIEPLDRMPADQSLPESGICQFATAVALIGIGLSRNHWTASPADPADSTSGALILTGRSGPARVYFAATAQAAIRLGTNGLIADNDDVVIIHSHENPPAMPRYPRRAPGRVGLAAIRNASMEELLSGGTEVQNLLDRFRSKVAL